jgi:hypothetical protein
VETPLNCAPPHQAQRETPAEVRSDAKNQETGDGVLDALVDRVGFDQDELTDDFAGMDGVHESSPSLSMKNPDEHGAETARS